MTRFLFALLLTSALGCSGGSKVGETCKTSGTTSECADGAVCTSVTAGNAVCRKMCTVASECAADETCEEIPGTALKSCQPN